MELRDVPGIGDKTIDTLAQAGITSIPELLTTFPRTYRTYKASTVDQVQIGEWVILKGTVTRPVSRHTGRVSTQVATFWDSSGSLTVRWFNMPYLSRSLSTTSTYIMKGVVSEFNGRRQIVSPQLSKIEGDTPLKDEIVAIYRAQNGVKPWILRQKISQTLDAVGTQADPMPQEIVAKYNLLPYDDCVRHIHHPANNDTLENAIRRLSFQELYELQLTAIRTKNAALQKGHAFVITNTVVDDFLSSLPFEPTASQKSAIADISADLKKPVAMHRLLQGEVGSGKTVVAVAAALAAYSAGYRALVMAPTQILALQLFDNFTKFCQPRGLTVSLMTAKSRGDSTADIIVGTQAILTRTLPDKIGLVIVDEQHRFGVEQRQRLSSGATAPHLLQMTATPIPRSLAQTVFRHLDITRLIDVPRNRIPTKTFVVPENKRQDSYSWIREEIRSNHNQVFIVVPLIEIAEENDATPLKSIKELETSLTRYFPDLTIDVMHGRMKEAEKVEHITRFKDGITHILVATSMIEVGIDIPEANIMVIEDAERFGLAQLHQLRGRVGRGGKQGYCLLFSSSSTDKTRDRLGFFVRENNGEKLAQYDLEKRGPGELFGTLQSGFFNLSMGNMYDEKLLKDTYAAAKMTLSLDKKGI